MFKAIITAAAIGLIATQAGAQQPQCGPREKIVEVMAKKYGEVRQVMALTSKGLVMELFANPAKGNWTALMSRPDGVSCIVAHGEGFTVDDVEPAGIDG